MDLSIVLITWRSKELLRECLDSIIHGTTDIDYEIIVVDNNSQDGTVQMIQDSYPEIRLILNSKNRGVAPARNQGIQIADGRYILLLDVDTLVMPKALDNLVDFMDENPGVGLVGPKLVSKDHELQLSCRHFPTIFSKILRRLPLSWAKNRLKYELLADWNHSSIREVDYVIGACQIIRREALYEVGLLDDKIFYGPEDIDYCIRMWRKGWAVCYNPHVTVIHYEQRVTKKPLSRLSLLHLKGLIYYFFKYRYLFNASRLRA